MKLISAESSEHYVWGNNCDSWKLVQEENISIKFEKMPPLSSEKVHFHSRSQQTFYVLKGTVTFEVDKKKYKVEGT
jgi:mannose-6-phosphate isomerase-like protein (cupin superfamily)